MPADSLTGLSEEPAEVAGHGPVTAETARALLSASAENAAVLWFRRLFTSPDGVRLVALDSRHRRSSDGLRRVLVLRDKTCRTPWCDAPIRHDDHVVPAGHGGPTSAVNGQGLCAACNQAKEAVGWSSTVVHDDLSRAGPHRVRLRTPTGHQYDSTAPPVLEARRAGGATAAIRPDLALRPDLSWLEHAVKLRLDAA